MEKEKYTSPIEDLGIVEFGDKRLTKRLVESTEERMKGVKTRSSAKGFYRLLGNEKFDRHKLERVCAKRTIERMSSENKILLIQDSTDVNLNGHKKPEGLGYCSRLVKGIQVHSCLAVSVLGLPLGLMSQSYETRAEAKSSLSANAKKSRPIEEKESFRWVETLQKSVELIPKEIEAIALCDREGDIFDRLCDNRNTA
jgi:hypothetical protein